MTSLVQFHPSYALSPRDKMRLAKMGLIEDEVREEGVKKELRRAAKKRIGNGTGSSSPSGSGSGSASSSPTTFAEHMIVNQNGAMEPPNVPLPLPPHQQYEYQSQTQPSSSTSSSRQTPTSILRKPSYTSSPLSPISNRNVPLAPLPPTPPTPTSAAGSYTHMPPRLLRRKSSRVRFTEELEAGPSGTSMIPNDFMPPLLTVPSSISSSSGAPRYGVLHRGSSTSSSASARSDPFSLETALRMGMENLDSASASSKVGMGIGSSRSPRSSLASSDDGAFNPQPLRYPRMSKNLARLSGSSYSSSSEAWQTLAVTGKRSSIASSIASSSPLPAIDSAQRLSNASAVSSRSWAPSDISLAPSDSVSYKRDASISSLLSNYYDPRLSTSSQSNIDGDGGVNGRPSVTLSSLPSSVAPALRHSVSASNISLTSLPSSVAPSRRTDAVPYVPRASVSSSLLSSGSEVIQPQPQHRQSQPRLLHPERQLQSLDAAWDQRKPSITSTSSSSNISSIRNLTSNRAAYASLLPTPHLRPVASLPSINRSGWLNSELGLSPRSTPRELQDDGAIQSPLPVPRCSHPISPSVRSSTSSFSATNVDEVIARAYATDSASEASVSLSLSRTDTNSNNTDHESIDCAIARAYLQVPVNNDERSNSLGSAASNAKSICASDVAVRPAPVREESIDDLIGRAHVDGYKYQFQPQPQPQQFPQKQYTPSLRRFNDSPLNSSPVMDIPLFPVPPERARPVSATGLNIAHLRQLDSSTPASPSSRTLTSPTHIAHVQQQQSQMQTTPKTASVASWVLDEATPVAPVSATVAASLQVPVSPFSSVGSPTLAPSPLASAESLANSPSSFGSLRELESDHEHEQEQSQVTVNGSSLNPTAPSLPKISTPPASPNPILRPSPASSVPTARISGIPTPQSPVLSIAAPATPLSARNIPLPSTPDSISTPRRLPKSPLRAASALKTDSASGGNTDESDLDLKEPLIQVALSAKIISNANRLHDGTVTGEKGKTTLGLGPMPVPSRGDGAAWSGSESEEEDFTMAVRAITDRKRPTSSSSPIVQQREIESTTTPLPAEPSTPTPRRHQVNRLESNNNKQDRLSQESSMTISSTASGNGPITPETGAILPSNVRLSISAAPGAYAWAASGPPSPAGSAKSASSGGSRRPPTLVPALSSSLTIVPAAMIPEGQVENDFAKQQPSQTQVPSSLPRKLSSSALPRPSTGKQFTTPSSSLPRPIARMASTSALPRPTGSTMRTPSASGLPRSAGGSGNMAGVGAGNGSNGSGHSVSSLPRPVLSSIPLSAAGGPTCPSPTRTTSLARPKFIPTISSTGVTSSASSLPRPRFTSATVSGIPTTPSSASKCGGTLRPVPTRKIDDWGAPEILVDHDDLFFTSNITSPTSTKARQALVQSLNHQTLTRAQSQSLKGRVISNGDNVVDIHSESYSPASSYGSSPSTPKGKVNGGVVVSPVALHVEYVKKTGSLNSPKRTRPIGNYI